MLRWNETDVFAVAWCLPLGLLEAKLEMKLRVQVAWESCSKCSRESSKAMGEASQGVTSGEVSDSLIVQGTSGGQVRPHGLSFMEAKEQNFGSPASVGLWLKAAGVGWGGGGFPRQINSLEPFCAVSGTSSPRAGLLGV